MFSIKLSGGRFDLGHNLFGRDVRRSYGIVQSFFSRVLLALLRDLEDTLITQLVLSMYINHLVIQPPVSAEVFQISAYVFGELLGVDLHLF